MRHQPSDAKKCLACVPLILLLGACVDPFEEVQDDGGPAPQPDQEVGCTEGQVRCLNQSYQRCVSNSWKQQKMCVNPQVCTVKLGCAPCDPSAGKGCSGNAVHACNSDGTIGAKEKDCLGLTCVLGLCRPPTCAMGARLVYVVDSQYRLLSFDPSKESNHFTLIAKLSCPASAPWAGRPAPATPFSMSVDRSARAWVLYTSGELFWVSTKDGSCKASPFQKGQQGFKLFGMGFVSDAAGSAAEKIYVTRAKLDLSDTQQLGYIDPATLKLTVVGKMKQAEYSAELSGTSKAELYGYHPGQFSSSVVLLDKKTGLPKKTWTVTPSKGQVTAWAFAHWGGKFYIFITASDGLFAEKSSVLRLDPATGKTYSFLNNIPYRIVGAGVSTCAPVID